MRMKTRYHTMEVGRHTESELTPTQDVIFILLCIISILFPPIGLIVLIVSISKANKEGL